MLDVFFFRWGFIELWEIIILHSGDSNVNYHSLNIIETGQGKGDFSCMS